jgi:photosystem II stability/assembly factor-like uncharacterized protein
MLVVAGARGLFTLNDSGDLGSPQFAGRQFMAMASLGQKVAVSVRKQGVMLSEDAGATWQLISADLPHQDVRSLAFDPHDPQRIYAGTEPAGIYRYDGTSWSPCADLLAMPEAKDWSFPVPPKIAHVRCIVVSPSDPQTIYALIEVGSFLISRDGGETWSAAEGIGHDLHRVILHPDQPQRLLAASGQDTGAYRGGKGLYRSDDGGTQWSQCNDGLLHRQYAEDAMGFAIDNPDRVFIAAADGIPPHWTSILKLAAGAITGNVYFLSPSRLRRRKGADVTIYRSDDAGINWTPVNDTQQHGLFDMVWALETGPADDGAPAVYFGTTGGEIRGSFDGGETWRTLATGLGAVTHLQPLTPI